jgi:flagella basal body P-ring formation protein FlgA
LPQSTAKLPLARCRQPLALDYYGARTSIRVICPDPGSWRVFVPLMQPRESAERAAVVSRRDLLRVEAGGAGFRVSRSGEALEDGGAGAMIRVRIDDGSRQGRVISAEVIEAGRVRVPIG